MRITFLLPTVNMSGGIKVAAIYAKALAALGHSVTLISPPPNATPLRAKFKSFLAGNGWSARKPAPKSHLDNSGLDHRVLDRWRPVTDADVPDADVVVATWWETAEWVNALGASKGAKVYFVQHHEIFPHLPVERCRATYRLPLHKIVIAPWLKAVMRSEYDDEVVDLVPNSVDRGQFFAAPRGKQAVPTAGFLYARAGFKGVDVAIAAIQAVRQRVPQLRLISFGAQAPTAALPIPEGTEFSLSPPQDQIRNLYAQCDVWIAASRTEGFNLPALEAMACRTPVVSTRAGWPADAIDSWKNGVLVDVDDVDGLAQGIHWVLTLPAAEWETLSQRAYETACAGSWEESTGQFERALLHACTRASRGEIAGRPGATGCP